MFGRTIKCCIANDNGRATEFIRRKYYPDKSTCYECGVRIYGLTFSSYSAFLERRVKLACDKRQSGAKTENEGGCTQKP